MTLWYHEELTILSRWSPRTSPDRPTHAVLPGKKVRLQRIREVPPSLAHLPPDELAGLEWPLNEDGTAWES